MLTKKMLARAKICLNINTGATEDEKFTLDGIF